MSEKRALTNDPIHEFLAERWSPYAFQERPESGISLTGRLNWHL